MSNIEWTQKTWNPIVGCSVVSPGCTNCYAMKMAARLDAMGMERYRSLTHSTKAGAVWTGEMRLVDEALTEPLRRRKPTMWFVNSMSDLFHERVPDAWIDRVFAVMALAPHHTFQVLTKRSARMRTYIEGCENPPDDLPFHMPWLTPWHRRDQVADAMREIGAKFPEHLGKIRALPLPNVWLGVSAEDQRRADERVPDLLATPAAVRFVSAEPLLGPIDFTAISDPDTGGADPWPHEVNSLTGDVSDDANGIIDGVYEPGQAPKLDWIIVGGESGHGARSMHLDWVEQIVVQGAAAGTAVFVKQLGRAPMLTADLSPGRPRTARLTVTGKGGDMAEWPPSLRVRQMPGVTA